MKLKKCILILAHGDPMWRLFYEDMQRRTAFFVSGKTGISSIRRASIVLGQEFFNATPILEELADKDRTVIIAGVYVASDVERLVRPNAIMRLLGGRKIDTLVERGFRLASPKSGGWSIRFQHSQNL